MHLFRCWHNRMWLDSSPIEQIFTSHRTRANKKLTDPDKAESSPTRREFPLCTSLSGCAIDDFLTLFSFSAVFSNKTVWVWFAWSPRSRETERTKKMGKACMKSVTFRGQRWKTLGKLCIDCFTVNILFASRNNKINTKYEKSKFCFCAVDN